MFDRTVEEDPRSAAPPSREKQRMRNGHRREYAAGRDGGSISFPERCARGLADIGVYGAVSYRDLAEARFGGHPHTTKRAVNAWVRDGLVTETRATGPKGNPFKVLSLTRKGVAKARKLAAERGMDPAQQIRIARTKPAQAAHDTAVYRACWKERRRLVEQGATVKRVRLDTELKSAAARASEAARLKNGKRAADAERHDGVPADARERRQERADRGRRQGHPDDDQRPGPHRSDTLPGGTAGWERPRSGGEDGAVRLHPPRCRSRHAEMGGRSHPRPRSADRHPRSAGRGATARAPATCGIGGVPIACAISCPATREVSRTRTDRHRRPRAALNTDPPKAGGNAIP